MDDSLFLLLLLMGGITGVVCFIAGLLFLGMRLRGVTDVAIPHFGKLRTTQNGAVALFFGLLLFWYCVSAYNTHDDLTKSLSFLSRHLTRTLINERSFRDFINDLTPAQRGNFQTQGALLLQKEYLRVVRTRRSFTEPDFTYSRELVEFLRSLDDSNGNVFYFDGQINHAVNKTNPRLALQMDVYDPWFKYLEVAGSPSEERADNETYAACYKSVRGYCRERSGWIRHTLAYVYYIVSQERDKSFTPDMRLMYLAKSNECESESLADYPKGFQQYMESHILQSAVERRLALADKTHKTDEKSYACP